MSFYIRFNKFFPIRDARTMIQTKVIDENVANMIYDFLGGTKKDWNQSYNQVVKSLKNLMVLDRDSLNTSFLEHECEVWTPEDEYDDDDNYEFSNAWDDKEKVYEEIAIWENMDAQRNRSGVQSILKGVNELIIDGVKCITNSSYRDEWYGYYIKDEDQMYDGPLCYYEEEYDKYKKQYDFIHKDDTIYSDDSDSDN